MSARAYRILHYAPDPSCGVRYPVAALARLDTGVKVFLAPHVPRDECLGGPGRSRFVNRIQQRLMKVRDIDVVTGLGPYCEISAPIPLQDDADAAFVEKMVSAWHSPLSRSGDRGRVDRNAEGYRWLAAHHVDHFVKRRFQPGSDIGRFLAHAPALETVSQYVPGIKSLVLMEPLVLRPRMDDDIRKVALRFGAYRAALDASATGGPTVDMLVYALPGTPQQSIEDAELSVSFASAKVFAVGDAVQKSRLLDRIREVGAETLLVN